MGNQLAKRVQENTQVAQTGGEQPATLEGQIKQMESQFQMAMPKGAEAAQLVRDALTCLRNTPKLKQCEPKSVLGALMTCSQLGLRVGVLGHAWPLPFYDKRSRSHQAQLIIGYQGYRELAMRSGQIASVVGRMIHAHDHFDIDYGVADNLVHKPYLQGDRGEAIGYYSIVKYANGGYAFWHMSKPEVEQHRDKYAMARAKDGTIVGPWRDDFDSMAVKTTFIKLAKWMPKTTELASALQADETVRVDLTPDPDAMLTGTRPDIDGEVVATNDSDENGYRPDDPDLAAHEGEGQQQ